MSQVSFSATNTTDKNNNISKNCKNLGMAAGFAGRLAYVAKKEGKDVFKSAAQEAVKMGHPAKAGILIKAGSIGVVALGFALAGRLIGAGVAKLVNSIKGKKQDSNDTKPHTQAQQKIANLVKQNANVVRSVGFNKTLSYSDIMAMQTPIH